MDGQFERRGRMVMGGGGSWADGLGRDVRYALRSLRRSPGFVLVAVLCLGLGIGANAAIFSVVRTVLLRPLPYVEPERLVRLYETLKHEKEWYGSVSYPNYLDWRDQNAVLDELALYQGGSANLQGLGEPERLITIVGSANLFATPGARAALGRTFAEGEDQPGRNAVVVLTHGFWRRRFGADRAVVGRTVFIDNEPRTVIGIMPADFRFPAGGGSRTDVILPLTPSEGQRTSRGSHAYAALGRLRAEVTIEQAEAQMRQIAERLEEQYPGPQAQRSVLVRSLESTVVGRVRPALLVLFGAVGLVLLIACANVANLLLARAAARRQEVAIRLALGASRIRLVRQFLVESLVLALGGALVGALLAYASLESITPLVDRALPRASEIGLDAGVFLFLLGAAAGSGIVFGLVPALQASSADVRENLSDAGTKSTAGGGHQRLRSTLVVAEIALSLVLLAGAGLLMRGFLILLGTEPGLEARGVLTAHVSMPTGKYGTGELAPKFLRPILDRVRAIPGVRSAAMISMLPIQSAWTNLGYTIEGETQPEPGKEPIAEFRIASPGVFASLGVPVVDGRDFTPEDGATGRKVAVVNQTLVRRHFEWGSCSVWWAPTPSPASSRRCSTASAPATR